MIIIMIKLNLLLLEYQGSAAFDSADNDKIHRFASSIANGIQPYTVENRLNGN